HPGGHSPIERRFGEWFMQMVPSVELTKLHPMWSCKSIIHSPGSQLTVPDDALRDVAMRYVQDGQMFTVYLGHSGPDGLWSNGARFLDRKDWSELNAPNGPGIFFSCGCHGCELHGQLGEGYGLAAIRNPHGPVAVIGAHGESYSAMGYLAVEGLLECLS